MFNRHKYLEKLFDLTEETAKREIEDICKEVGFIPDHYSICIMSGGISYTLEKIASDLYLSRKPLCDMVRQKLFLFNIIAETWVDSATILRRNELIKETKNSWGQQREVSLKVKTVEELLKIIDRAYRNCDTCADHPNGCGGEDKDCCAPDYKDWRG